MPRGVKTCPNCQATTGPRSHNCPECNHDFFANKSAPTPAPTRIEPEQATTPPVGPVEPPTDAEPTDLPTTSMKYVMEKGKPAFDFRRTIQGRPLAIVKTLRGETIEFFLSQLAIGKAGYLPCRTNAGDEIILGVELVTA